MAENTQIQLVTFQLGGEIYGVDIMDVKEIVKIVPVRPIPNAPYYVEEIQPPPQMISGIGTEYIHGVIRQEGNYLIMLDIRRLFNANELQKILGEDEEETA